METGPSSPERANFSFVEDFPHRVLSHLRQRGVETEDPRNVRESLKPEFWSGSPDSFWSKWSYARVSPDQAQSLTCQHIVDEVGRIGDDHAHVAAFKRFFGLDEDVRLDLDSLLDITGGKLPPAKTERSATVSALKTERLKTSEAFTTDSFRDKLIRVLESRGVDGSDRDARVREMWKREFWEGEESSVWTVIAKERGVSGERDELRMRRAVCQELVNDILRKQQQSRGRDREPSLEFSRFLGVPSLDLPSRVVGKDEFDRLWERMSPNDWSKNKKPVDKNPQRDVKKEEAKPTPAAAAVAEEMAKDDKGANWAPLGREALSTAVAGEGIEEEALSGGFPEEEMEEAAAGQETVTPDRGEARDEVVEETAPEGPVNPIAADTIEERLDREVVGEDAMARLAAHFKSPTTKRGEVAGKRNQRQEKKRQKLQQGEELRRKFDEAPSPASEQAPDS